MRHAVEGVEAGAEQDLVHWQRSIREPCRILGSGQCMLTVCEGRSSWGWAEDDMAGGPVKTLLQLPRERE